VNGLSRLCYHGNDLGWRNAGDPGAIYIPTTNYVGSYQALHSPLLAAALAEPERMKPVNILLSVLRKPVVYGLSVTEPEGALVVKWRADASRLRVSPE
jgi:hypothetical protein